MQIIAHRGASYFAPENTLEAFRLGLEQGADGIELDVRMTLDGEIAALHDKSAKRTCGVSKNICDIPYEVIKTLDAGSYKSEQYRLARIPLLKDVLDFLPLGRQIYIEIKCGREIIAPLGAMLADFKSKCEYVTVFGFGYETVKEFKKNFPHVKTLWIGEFGFNIKNREQMYDSAVNKIVNAGLDGFSTKNCRNHCFQMRERLRDKIFNVWTVDSTDDAAYYGNLGITSLTTNRPDLMRRF